MANSRFSQSKGLIVLEIIIYGVILIWFLRAFLPIGLM
ncbi:hypothetical protein CHY_0356 [Calderihabitans maritimus]|uniref:Uncharacterized protein n=1 Tax=Calderihabitans maritimus TaxID=1246530 RepID=A0A1Z5HPT1_9FIRM|nr:hypothetical protein CHY_0356 [Calderihabitans maritimus]